MLFVLCPLCAAGYAVANGATAVLLAAVAALTPQLLRVARAAVEFVRTGGGVLEDQPDRLGRVLHIVERRLSSDSSNSSQLVGVGDDALGAEEGPEL